MLYIPAGFAHGFQNLSDELTVEYVMDARHDPAQSDGFRHDDPAVGIRWPLPVTVISERDRAWPPLPMWAGLAEART
jgi:dTDP-4-dehydrorhamnose 3,5-epimerase